VNWLEVLLVAVTGITGAAYLFCKVRPRHRFFQSGWFATARDIFPTIALIFLLRSFVAEPFRIPSNSMMPTLLAGDFILVNKFAYGLRLPVTSHTIVPVGRPERGDVVVFRPPHHPGQDWIKRVVGLPGDRISYHDNMVAVNGEVLTYARLGVYEGTGRGREMTGAVDLREDLLGREHRVLEHTDLPSYHWAEGDWIVPSGHYFVMGDNRDNSDDSRFWGFLPERNLRGKAFVVLFNYDSGFAKSRTGLLLD